MNTIFLLISKLEKIFFFVIIVCQYFDITKQNVLEIRMEKKNIDTYVAIMQYKPPTDDFYRCHFKSNISIR
jgi:hypothetical protein